AAVARAAASNPSWNAAGLLEPVFLPLLTQEDFDHLLWCCDFNFVRGEDSLVRALWAGKPFAWQIYPQHDEAHRAKLAAFLDWIEAPPAWRDFHWAWNAFAPVLPEFTRDAWSTAVERARRNLLDQDDLVTQLMRYVASKVGAAP
ncbi:MAG: elongation factor P maturation arginine rhamnosyltransferase EarP, partial [Ramlibacter sp.]